MRAVKDNQKIPKNRPVQDGFGVEPRGIEPLNSERQPQSPHLAVAP